MADDLVTRRDRQLFREELLRANALLSVALWSVVWWFVVQTPVVSGLLTSLLGRLMYSHPDAFLFLIFAVGVGALAANHVAKAGQRARQRHFINLRLRAQWTACEERLKRFRTALTSLRKDQIADFAEMPKTIESVGQSVYLALRRADLVLDEISRSEGWMHGTVAPFVATDGSQVLSHDPQAKELYRIADRNLAEYRANYAGVIAGVQRTEAQAAVYSTTLDTIRLKMLGYRLSGQRPDMSSQDLLEAMSEAKLQLRAIDSALEELELGPFPKMVATMPGAEPSFTAADPELTEEALRDRLRSAPSSSPPPVPDHLQRREYP